jgi:hypothetical protein
MRRIRRQRPTAGGNVGGSRFSLLGHETPTSFERAVSTPEPTQGGHEDGDRERVPAAGRVMRALASPAHPPSPYLLPTSHPCAAAALVTS